MQKLLLGALVLGGSALYATSALEEAVLKEDRTAVRALIASYGKKNLSDSEKLALLKRAQLTAQDVIQEHQDSTQIWNSWNDIGKCFVGTFGFCMLVASLVASATEGLSMDKLLSLGFSGGLVYLGVRGIQCKAQQYRLEAPSAIARLLDREIDSLEDA